MDLLPDDKTLIIFLLFYIMNRFYLAALFGFCLSTGLWAQRTELLLEKNWKFTKGDPSGAADLWGTERSVNESVG